MSRDAAEIAQELVDKGIDEHWDDVFEPMRNVRDSTGIADFLMKTYKKDWKGQITEEELIEELIDHIEEGFPA